MLIISEQVLDYVKVAGVGNRWVPVIHGHLQ